MTSNGHVHRINSRTSGYIGTALALVLLLGSGAKAQQTPPNSGSGAKPSGQATGKSGTRPGANPTLNSSLNSSLLNYQFTPGAKVKFKVSALFDGHFPPFAQPDSPPVHVKTVLGYTATVLKVDAEGATVEFVVDSREMYLFKNEIAEDAKVDITDGDNVAVLDGLTSLEDIQKALNATAVLRPDGTVVRILSKSSVKVPFDVGFDIRKLFLMMLPVTFPNKPVKPGDTWAATDGLLGSKAGKTEYSDRLESMTGSGNENVYRLSQSAKSVVEDRLDKTGASTAKDMDVYRVLNGKVDLKTETTFVVPGTTNATAPGKSSAPGKADTPAKGEVKPDKNGAKDTIAKVQAGQVKSVHLVMNAVINRKRVKIDPDQPEIPENEPLDVRARMTITRVDTPVVASGKGAPGGDAQKQKPKADANPDGKSGEKAKKSS